MIRSRLMLLAACVALSTGCSSFSASIDYDKTFDFGGWKTYIWTASPGAKHADPVTGKILVQLINNTMRSKGMQRTNERPDFRIAAMVASRRGSSGGWGGRYGGGGGYGYTAGSIIISLTDAKTKNMVWWATASDVVDLDDAAEGKMKAINKALATIFKDFPPPAPGGASGTTAATN